MKLLKSEVKDFEILLKALLDKRKVKLKGDTITILGDDDILIEKNNKIVKEKTVLHQFAYSNVKAKYNFFVSTFLMRL